MDQLAISIAAASLIMLLLIITVSNFLLMVKHHLTSIILELSDTHSVSKSSHFWPGEEATTEFFL